jgi:hypothetical protein
MHCPTYRNYLFRIDLPVLANFPDGEWKREIGRDQSYFGVGRMNHGYRLRLGHLVKYVGNVRWVGPLPKNFRVLVMLYQWLNFITTSRPQCCH